ncbi:MAG: phosphodiester glycosidase family protein [Bacteroidales bacterium]|nr:phosphodiester glycosidase family protein [Candidatus Cacconaster merdequi]
MKKTVFSLVALMLCIVGASAQNDCSTFSSAAWETRTVSDGIVLKQCSFQGNLFDSFQYISVLEVSGRKVDIIDAPAETLQKTSQLAAQAGAAAAINGGFFRMRPPYGSIMFLRIDNEDVAGNGNDMGSGDRSRSTRQTGAVATYGKEMFIVKADALSSWEKYIQAEDVLTSGPIMRIGGEDVDIPQVAFNTTRHPRTAVGKKADGTVVFVVVDGRSKGNAEGMSIVELRSVMEWLGCKDALNLDGGGSSAMIIGSDLVNYPCDNKKFDHEGERKVANILVVR